MRNNPFAIKPANRAVIPGAKRDTGFLATQEPHEYMNQALYETTLDYIWGSSAEVKTFGTADFYTDSNGDPFDINDAAFTIENGSKILMLLENTKISRVKLNAGGKEFEIGSLNQGFVPMGSQDLIFNGTDDIVTANFKASGTGTVVFDCKLVSAVLELISMNVAPAHNIVVNGRNQIAWTSAQPVGAGLSIAGISQPALTALNDTDVAFIDSTTKELRAYRFDGNTWSLVGSDFSISGIGKASLAAVNDTDVAFIDGTLEELRMYRFNGSTWSLVGSGFSISGIWQPALTALNDTDVAFIDATLEELKTYRFSGSTWSLVGNGLSVPGIGTNDLTTLNSTDVAFIDDTQGELRTYRFDGSDWSLVGNGLSISGIGQLPTVAAINGTDVALIDQGVEVLNTYRFNGSNWSLVGTGLSIPSIFSTALTALNSTDVAFVEGNEIATYRFGYSISNPPYRPS